MVTVRTSEVSLAILDVNLALKIALLLNIIGVGLSLIWLRGRVGADPWNVTAIIVLEHF